MSEARSIGTAPGKVILFGEHAVVYGRPAIAVPVTQVQAIVTVEHARDGFLIVAEDLGKTHFVGQPGDEQTCPLEVTVRNTLAYFGLPIEQNLRLSIRSTIPIGRGMGSGTAVSTAIVRALAAHFARRIPPDQVCRLVFQTEIIYHGTPSGIDNTVIAYGKPVYFIRDQRLETFTVGHPFRLAIADTGIFSPTRVAVGDVRHAWERQRARYEALFDAIGDITNRGRKAIETGDHETLGRLMDENQALLREVGVSSPELERLITAASRAGALGAKLCGAGRGGNMIALIAPEVEKAVVAALQSAGATQVLVTDVGQV